MQHMLYHATHKLMHRKFRKSHSENETFSQFVYHILSHTSIKSPSVCINNVFFSCKTQITRFLASALTDEDFGGAQGQAEFVRTLGMESQGGGGGSGLGVLLKELAEELVTLEMFDEVHM